jgi:hypothetical protein
MFGRRAYLKLLRTSRRNLRSALIKASSYGYIEIVRYVLDEGITSRYKALQAAVYHGHLEIVSLLSSGVDLSKLNLMSEAAFQCQPEMLRFLISLGVTPTFQASYTAVQTKNFRTFTRICNHVQISEDLFQLAVRCRNVEACEIFLKSGIDVTTFRRSPFVTAIRNRDIPIIELLMSFGVKINDDGIGMAKIMCRTDSYSNEESTEIMKFLRGAVLNLKC